MPFGFIRMSAIVRSLLAVPAGVESLRRGVHQLQEQVQHMATAQEQTLADIDALGTKLNAWLAAGAAAQQKALDDAKAAWEANDEEAWTAAHTKLSTLINAVPAGEPVTPPPSATDPSPAPVEAPPIVAAPAS